jgi:3-phytase
MFGAAVAVPLLLVSSQGDNTFYTYDRFTNRPLRHYAVMASAATDGVQDCVDDDGEVRANTDFKYLDAGFLRR